MPHNQKDIALRPTCACCVCCSSRRFFHGSASRKIVKFFPPFRLYWPGFAASPTMSEYHDAVGANTDPPAAFTRFPFINHHIWLVLVFVVYLYQPLFVVSEHCQRCRAVAILAKDDKQINVDGGYCGSFNRIPSRGPQRISKDPTNVWATALISGYGWRGTGNAYLTSALRVWDELT